MEAYSLSSMVRLVIDTNVFVAAMRPEGGASRAVLKHALTGGVHPFVRECAVAGIRDYAG